MDMYWEIELFDNKGRIVKKYKQPCRSLLANFLRIWRGMLLAKGGYTGYASGLKASCIVKGLDGSNIEVWTEWYTSDEVHAGGTCMGAKADEGDDSYGIVVGSGSTPVTMDDYNLESKISHGTGDGQLYYGSHGLNVIEETGQVKVQINRSFMNHGSINVTVREVGLIARNYWKDGTGIKKDVKFLIIRDVLASPIDVPPAYGLSVKFTIAISTG